MLEILTILFSKGGCNDFYKTSILPLFRINRILWLLLVIVFAVLAISVNKRNYYRYMHNATNHAVEVRYQLWTFPMFGFTVCSNYTNVKRTSELVQRWAVNRFTGIYYKNDILNNKLILLKSKNLECEWERW